MKKVISLLAFTMCLGFAYSQAPAGKAPLPFVMTAKDSALAKAWKIKRYECFGEVYQEGNLPKKQANDGLTLSLDQTAFFTYDGVLHTGKWVTDKTKTIITITDDAPDANGKKVVNTLKILKGGSEELEIKYQDKDLITTLYTLVPKK